MSDQTEMVDRVARALVENFPHSGWEDAYPQSWESLDEGARITARNQARAAIEAMMEPTEEMLDAARKAQDFSLEGMGPNIGRGQDRKKHQAMIKAALGESHV